MNNAEFARQPVIIITKIKIIYSPQRMKEVPKLTVNERRQAAHQLIEASKKPYLVRDMPRTILYLTAEQAAKRQDLIPQSGL